MSFLRRISTRHLIMLCAAVVAAAAAGTALAIAAGSGGPRPPAKPLDAAVQDAVTAPAVEGVTARIKFTNNLIDSASLQGTDPLLSGATGRLWAAKDGRVRLELQSSGGDAQLVSDGTSFWVYDAASRTVYRGRLPHHADTAKGAEQPPTLKEIDDAIAKIAEHWDLSGAEPSNVAGLPAYTVRLAPKHDGGLLGSAALAWDAARGTPLRAAVYAQGHTDPVLELEATQVSFGPVSGSAFDVSPPAGAKTVDLSPASKPSDRADHQGEKPITGLSAVRQKVGFDVSAPAQLVGLPRGDVRATGGTERPTGDRDLRA